MTLRAVIFDVDGSLADSRPRTSTVSRPPRWNRPVQADQRIYRCTLPLLPILAADPRGMRYNVPTRKKHLRNPDVPYAAWLTHMRPLSTGRARLHLR